MKILVAAGFELCSNAVRPSEIARMVRDVIDLFVSQVRVKGCITAL